MHADLESIVCKFGGDPTISMGEEAICAKVYRRTDGRSRRTDGRTDDGRLGGIKLQYSCSIAVLTSFLPNKKFTHSWNELKSIVNNPVDNDSN